MRNPGNIRELKTVILDEWDKIDESYVKKLIDSLPRRIRAILRMRGGHTKY